MADNNYYSQQPPGGHGRGFSSGGRRGRGRGYRGRAGGRFPAANSRGGGRSFDAGGRASVSYYGASSSTIPPPQLSSVGRGEHAGGRFGPPPVMASSSNVPPTIMTNNAAAPESSMAPNIRGRGPRGGGRFYDTSGRGGGRRGRGHYASTSRGGARGRMPQETARGSYGPATDMSSSQPPAPWAASAQSHDTTGWNYERNPSFEAARNSSSNTASDWNTNAPNQGGGAPMEVDSSSDWAGRDRDWNNSHSAASQDVNEGTQGSWNNQDSNWNAYRGGGGASNLQHSMRGGLAQPPNGPTTTRSVPFHDEQQSDIYAKRKRGEAPPYNVGGQPFEEKRLREGPTTTSSYASLGEGAFQNPLASTNTQPPTMAAEEGGPSFSQPYRGSSWRGRGRGASRGRTSRGRGRGRHLSGDYGQYSGRGAPPSSSSYHEGPQYQDSIGDGVAPGLSAYGPQSVTNEFGRPSAPASVPPSDRAPFSQGETINTSWGAFRRPSRDPSPAINRPTAPVPPVPSGSHADAPGVSNTSANIGTAAPVPKPSVSAGSYASLAESSPFVAAQVAREPAAAAPPLSYSAMDSKPVSARPKSATPPPEPKAPVQRPPTPPSPVGPPSGLMVALARLADLESQLDFALAKHSQVVRERELIQEQTKHLQELPIGVEAFEDDLANLAPAAATAQEPVQ